MIKNIYVDDNGNLQWATNNLALAYNLLQQIGLEQGEDKCYSRTGIPWIEIIKNSLDAFPYINGAISYGYPNTFITNLTTLVPKESYKLDIKISPSSTLLTATLGKKNEL